jgi:hypothetical protein
MQITKAHFLLAAAVVVGSIFVATITIAETGTSVALLPSAYADANCDKANMERNDQGHVRGNPKQCSGHPNTEGEQPIANHCIQALTTIVIEISGMVPSQK